MKFSPDTDLLVYAQDARYPVEQRVALRTIDALVADGCCAVGLQVVGELYSVLTRRLKVTPTDARDSATAALRPFDAFGYDDADVHAAVTLAADGVFSCWDGLLVASATRARCRDLIAEDMQDGFR